MIKNIDRRDEKICKIREKYLEYYYDEDKNLNLDMLQSLGLKMYSQKENIKSLIYSAFSKSTYDNKIVMHPQQMECLNVLQRGENLLISAPTSFGKTFVALEYISRNDFCNIAFVVPTLALMNELFIKIKNRFGDKYNIIQNAFETFYEKNIIIIVPERADNELLSKINKIDLLVFDEIYKLQRQKDNENNKDKRIISLNKGYFDLVDKSSQVLLLGPFIKNITFERTKLTENITKYISDFSPVYNKIEFIEEDKDTFVLNELCKNNPKLVYFTSPKTIYDFSERTIDCIDGYESNSLIQWCEKYISDKWLPAEMLKKGIGIHHGRLPNFMRRYVENLYNNGDIDALLCTSTLLEGINTPTNELIVYDSSDLSAFRINNLIGRVGRLNTFQKGQIFLFDKKLEQLIIGEEKYEEIRIVAETNDLLDIEEVIYLGKSENELNEEGYEQLAKLKIDLIKYSKSIVDLEKTDGFVVSELIKLLSIIDDIFDIVKKFNNAEGKETTKIKGEIIEKIMTVIPYTRNYLIQDINSTLKTNRIKTSICVGRLLNYVPQSIYERIKKEINKHNKKLNSAQLNIFIDYLFDLAFSYIKYDLSRIVNYFDFLFDEDYLKEKDYEKELFDTLNEEVLKRLRIFNSDNDKLLKILLDLDFPYSDAKQMSKIIVKDIENEKLSVSKVIDLLMSNFDNIVDNNKIEDVSKDLLKVLLQK